MTNNNWTIDQTKQLFDLCEKARNSGQEYHIILMDEKMPGMDGVETAEKIRAGFSRLVPILFLTACDEEDMPEAAFHLGNMEIMPKPFFVSAFKEKIRNLQSGHGKDSKPPQDTSKSMDLGGLHFLVAEDNAINAEILSELLELENASCEITENGQLVVERFRQADENEFDAILMDVQMPVMNGYDATRAIRGLHRRDAAKIPIIAMTANAFAEDEMDALYAGMSAHVAKPIDMGLLKKTLGQYIERNNYETDH